MIEGTVKCNRWLTSQVITNSDFVPPPPPTSVGAVSGTEVEPRGRAIRGQFTTLSGPLLGLKIYSVNDVWTNSASVLRSLFKESHLLNLVFSLSAPTAFLHTTILSKITFLSVFPDLFPRFVTSACPPKVIPVNLLFDSTFFSECIYKEKHI